MLSRKLIAAVAMVALSAVSLVGQSAHAAGWAGFAAEGSNNAFGWSSVDDFDASMAGHIGTDGALMGTPSINENGFFFLNPNFTVDANDVEIDSVNEWGVSISGTNIGSITIPDVPGGSNPDLITEIIVRESGTYVSDDPQADFNLQTSITVTQVAPSPPLPFLPFETKSVTLLGGDYNFYPDGTWDVELIYEADKSAILSPTGFDTFRLDLTNLFQLTPTGVGNGSSISKTRADVIIPEPATSLLLMMGVAVGLRRRR